MSIETRIVSDSKGRITNYKETIENKEVDVKIVGTIQAENLYTFYAVNSGIENPTPEDTKEITMVLPVGGALSGIYRFPRVGEKVLVEVGGTSDSANYLLGYIPSELNAPFAPVDAENTTGTAEKNKLLEDGQGVVLRYQQTGKKTAEAGEEYSEIGFYHEQTSWKTSKSEAYNKVDTTKGCPKIDTIHLHSTGDMRSYANNYHEIKAKRLELLAGLESYDHTQDDEEGCRLGDNLGDDSNLYAGDAHIRAKNRIIIKADDEIVLQVGRSVININDAGISLSSKKVKGNYVNPWDTVISLTPRGGINMFGQHLNMTGAFDFSLTDTMGSSLSSMAGIVRILGKDIKLSTITTIGYIGKQVTMLSQLIACIEAVGVGMNKKVDPLTGMVGSLGSAILPLAFTIFEIINGKDSDPEDADPISLYLVMLGILLKINEVACGVLAEKMRTKKQLKDNVRDEINLAQLLVEYSLLTASTIAFVAYGVQGMTHRTMIHLRGSAHMEMNSLTRKVMGTEGEDVSAPLAGYVNKAKTAAVKKVKEMDFKGMAKDGLAKAKESKGNMAIAIGIALAALVGLGAIVTSGAAAVGVGDLRGDDSITSRFSATKKEDQETLDALREL
jgi:hypothetical protein